MVGRQECIRSVRKERIKLEKLRDAQVRRVYQTNMASRCREVKHALQEASVEEVWKVVKEVIVSSAARACGIDKRRNGMKKRTRRWNDEVQFAIRRMKRLYKEMLNADTEEARQRYSEANSEARRVVRKAKNEEWVQFGRVIEKEAIGNQ